MSADYELIAAAIRFIAAHADEQPRLDRLAAAIGLSPFHLQRLFLRWAGVTPKRYLQFLTVEHAKCLLAQSRSVLEASYETGLSGPGRLHDHFVSLEAVTPGDYKRAGDGLEIRYGAHPSPFGSLFLAQTERGICALAFIADRDQADLELAALRARWRGARIVEDRTATAAVAGRLFRPDEAAVPLSVLVRGSNFQIQVWKALLRIPFAHLSCYQHIARAVGRPSAARAVGQALAVNPVGYLIPCHRVIRSIGLPGGYRWGEARKQALLAWEAAQAAPDCAEAAEEAKFAEYR
jgi:AraC family transcriptional regulator of adaptative response/methylated-DNA-[protein]-cysteine methyltransferase